MSNIRRFFVDNVAEEIVLSGDEYKHAVNVLRLRKGDEVVICNNTEYEYVATVSAIAKKQVFLQVINKRLNGSETDSDVLLLCGFLKGDKTEYVVQKAVELGIKNIVIFSSKNSTSVMTDQKLERLRKVVQESSKQCGRSRLAKIEYCLNFQQALKRAKDYKNKIFAYENADKSELNINTIQGSTAVVVGPEGGFSEFEWQLAKKMSFKTIWLGKRILRADTASVVMLTLVMHTLGEI